MGGFSLFAPPERYFLSVCYQKVDFELLTFLFIFREDISPVAKFFCVTTKKDDEGNLTAFVTYFIKNLLGECLRLH